jgi:cell division protein FtsL
MPHHGLTKKMKTKHTYFDQGVTGLHYFYTLSVQNINNTCSFHDIDWLLTKERDQLQTSYNNLTKERDQLQTSYNNLTIERDSLQTSYNNLMKERDQLQTSNNNLTKERDQLQMSYNNLTKERPATDEL